VPLTGVMPAHGSGCSSERQKTLQPSPLLWLESSQSSPGSMTPLPQLRVDSGGVMRGVGDSVGVPLGVSLGEAVGVSEAVGEGEGVGVNDGVSVIEGVAVSDGVSVGGSVGVMLAVALNEAVGGAVGVSLGVLVSVEVGVDDAVFDAVAVADGLGGHPRNAAFTAINSSLMLTRPLRSKSAAAHVSTASPPSAMLTTRTSSLIVTCPSPSQSAAHGGICALAGAIAHSAAMSSAQRERRNEKRTGGG
jgi:hypothetical protein